jgi:hypothetical protein
MQPHLSTYFLKLFLLFAKSFYFVAWLARVTASKRIPLFLLESVKRGQNI